MKDHRQDMLHNVCGSVKGTHESRSAPRAQLVIGVVKLQNLSMDKL